MTKKYDDLDPNQSATYKQSWAVAYHFAELLEESYPDLSKKKLANIIKGTVYYYHQSQNDYLSHGMVQEYLAQLEVPSKYVEALNKFLNYDQSGKSFAATETEKKATKNIEKKFKDINFDELIVHLTDSHKEKLIWFMENKDKSFSWSEIERQQLAITSKGIYKPKDWIYALSTKTTMSTSYEDADIFINPSNGEWKSEYDLERQINGNKSYTSEALQACAQDFVPVGHLLQIKEKPNVTYRVIGPYLLKLQAKSRSIKMFGFSDEGRIKIIQ